MLSYPLKIEIFAICPRRMAAFTQGGRHLSILAFSTQIHLLGNDGCNMKYLGIIPGSHESSSSGF